MRVLIIGGTQFFGKQIVRQFLDRGDRVVVYSRGRRRPDVLAEVEHIQGDLSWRSTPVAEWLRVTAAWLATHAQEDSQGYDRRDAERRAVARWTSR